MRETTLPDISDLTEGWRPAAAGSAGDWPGRPSCTHPGQAPGDGHLCNSPVHTSAATTVEFRRDDNRAAAIIVYGYAEWRDECPGVFEACVTSEQVLGDTHSGILEWRARSSYDTQTLAEGAARYIVGLLTQCAFRDLERAAKGLTAGIFTWDGSLSAQLAVA